MPVEQKSYSNRLCKGESTGKDENATKFTPYVP